MINARSEKGIIFNIQRYSIHDGPGIRTSIFLKGCFLRCIWCQNPESQAIKPELFFFMEKCTGCGTCVAACPANAIRIIEEKSVTDRNACKDSGLCVQVCPGEARSLMGREMTGEQRNGQGGVFHGSLAQACGASSDTIAAQVFGKVSGVGG